MLLHNFSFMRIPVHFRRILDEVMAENRLDRITADVLWALAYTLITAAAMVVMRKLIIGVSRKVEFRFRNRLYEKILSLRNDFFMRHETGDLVSRCTNDLNDVRTLLGPGIMYVPNALSRLLIFLPVLFVLNTRLLVIISLMQGALVVLIVVVLPRLRPYYRRIQEFVGTINNRAWQVISGISTIRLYTAEEREIRRFADLNETYIRRQMDLVKRSGFLWPFFLFVISLTELVILLVGGREVIEQRLTLGELLQFSVMVSYLTFPVLSLGWIMSLLQQGISAMKRIRYILDQPERCRPGMSRLSGEGMRVRVKGLDFRYPGSDRDVLKDVHLDIGADRIVGITGPIGSGKSTLLHLICGIYDPGPGKVFINGQDVCDLDPRSLMERVSLVPQRTFLFSRSLEQNVRMGSRAGDDRIREVVAHAGLDDDIGSFPDGMAEKVGERGITLSGGQKQRIAIARALVKDAPLLIFDDALSSVDSKTEALILEQLIHEPGFRTLLLVSHRISSLKHADTIHVMKSGRIVESGSHRALLGKRGLYYQMARVQRLEGDGS